MSNFSHCTVHDTYPAAGDPCWGCVREFREFGDAKLQAENEKLKREIKVKDEHIVQLQAETNKPF